MGAGDGGEGDDDDDGVSISGVSGFRSSTGTGWRRLDRTIDRARVNIMVCTEAFERLDRLLIRIREHDRNSKVASQDV